MTTPITPEPGAMLVLRDEQYRFGLGPILCRVREVIAPVLFDEEPWWHLRADCADGTPDRHGGWHERELYVAASAVRRSGAARPPGPPSRSGNEPGGRGGG